MSGYSLCSGCTKACGYIVWQCCSGPKKRVWHQTEKLREKPPIMKVLWPLKIVECLYTYSKGPIMYLFLCACHIFIIAPPVAMPTLCCVVERRRRDRINDMIKTLAQIVPGCQKKDAATGNVVGVSLLWFLTPSLYWVLVCGGDPIVGAYM